MGFRKNPKMTPGAMASRRYRARLRGEYSPIRQGGIRLSAPKIERTVRDTIRSHLFDNRQTIKGNLAMAIGYSSSGASSLMCHKYPIAPLILERIIEFLELDDVDANRLRLQGAKEAGWNIDETFL